MQLMGWVWLFAAGAGWLLMQRSQNLPAAGRRFLKVAAALAVLPLSAIVGLGAGAGSRRRGQFEAAGPLAGDLFWHRRP